jgi:hypothetical protein
MTATTAWAAIDGLEAALKASDGLTAKRTRISQGFPTGGPLSDRPEVWIPAEIDDLNQVADLSGTAGVGKFEETYRLRIYIVRIVPASGTFKDHRAKLEEIVDPAVDAVRADQQLGGAVHLATPAGIALSESFASETTRSLDAVIWVDVEAFVC